MKKRIYGLTLTALLVFTAGGLSDVCAKNQKKENVVVELIIKGFSEPIVLKVPLNDLMGKIGSGGHDHYPDDIPGAYSYGIFARRLRRSRAIVTINLTLMYRDGTQKHINEKILVNRNKPIEAEYSDGVKVRVYFDAAPNNSFNRSGISMDVIRED